MPALPSKTSPQSTAESLFRHNVCVESFFSAFNGIFLGLILFASPVVAVIGLEASPLELTIIVAAFPVGAFLGPVWASLGRRWGMKNLVLGMMSLASVALLLIFWVTSSGMFTFLITVSQLMNSAMRMGQANLYRLVYPQERRGQVLGRLTFCTYVTMVPTMLLTGWLLDKSREIYQVLYPLGGICGLVGCCYFGMLHLPSENRDEPKRSSFRSSVQNVEQILRKDRLYLLFQIAFFLTGGSFFLSRHVILLLTRERFAYNAFELSLSLSVLPQMLQMCCSPFWGKLLDRIGMIPSRMLISLLLSASLATHFGGLVLGLSILIYVGSIFQGLANAGGEVTWYLASSHFAPRAEDVPLYNGIHFVLNGVRGLILPWVGSVMLVLTGAGAVLGAVLFSLGSIPVLWRALSLKDHRSGRLPQQVRAETQSSPRSAKEESPGTIGGPSSFSGRAS